MRRSFLIFLFIITMSLLLTGCGDDNKPEQQKQETKQDNQSKTTTDPNAKSTTNNQISNSVTTSKPVSTSNTTAQKIALIKNGKFTKYPKTTIGKAFDSFFGSPKWTTYRDNAGRDIVRFNGIAKINGKNATVDYYFMLTEPGKFKTISLYYDGALQSDTNRANLLKTIYSRY